MKLVQAAEEEAGVEYRDAYMQYEKWIVQPKFSWEGRQRQEREWDRRKYVNEMLLANWEHEDVLFGLEVWEKALFDTIEGKSVCFQNICVDMVSEFCLEGRSPVVQVLPRGKGTKSVLIAELRDLEVGCSIEQDVIFGVRDKIPGILHVRSGTVLEGPFPVELPEGVEVDLAEYFCGRYYILWPLHTRTQEIMGCAFIQHRFLSLTDYHPRSWSEGSMFLTVNGEQRTKYRNTTELNRDGVVWEASLEDGEVKFLRPRPGKIAGSLQRLYAMASPRDVLSKTLERYTVRYVQEEFSFRLEGSVIFIGRGFRVEEAKVKQLPEFIHPRTLNWNDQTVESIGSKLVLVEESGLMVFCEENGKLLDFLGGKKEWLENPHETMSRELKEELFDGHGVDFFFEMVSMGKNAKTHVFVGECRYKDIVDNSVCKLSCFTKEGVLSNLPKFQPWVPRILSHVFPGNRTVKSLWETIRYRRDLSRYGYGEGDFAVLKVEVEKRKISTFSSFLDLIDACFFEGDPREWLTSIGYCRYGKNAIVKELVPVIGEKKELDKQKLDVKGSAFVKKRT